jgi:hypothetical protein
MKQFNLGKLVVLALCLGAIGVAASADAQSVRHDIMDARGAKADIIKLKADRAIAKHQHNWGKVKQDNRLIANDRKFLHKDIHKVRNSG